MFNQFIELGSFYSIIVGASLDLLRNSYLNGIHPHLGFWTCFPGKIIDLVAVCVWERKLNCESMYAWLWHALRFTICSRIGDYLASSQIQCCGRSMCLDHHSSPVKIVMGLLLFLWWFWWKESVRLQLDKYSISSSTETGTRGVQYLCLDFDKQVQSQPEDLVLCCFGMVVQGVCDLR